MTIPFTKAHGARNDFLLSWAHEVPACDESRMAQALCDRHTGVGADGWILVEAPPAGAEFDGKIRLWNSDGSKSQISGNGTRCAGAFLLKGGASGPNLRLLTGAGLKHLRVLEAAGNHFELEMNMGCASVADGNLRCSICVDGEERDTTILDVGNPQCAVFVDTFPENWRALGKEIEWHPRFPQRTNVSFVRVVSRHHLDVRFWERGAGETMSSGTGSTGAAAAAVLRGLCESPVTVETPAGPLPVRWEGNEIYLTGPAELIASGEFFVR